MKTFQELLTSSARAHGHLCPGQVIGVRMALLGCRLLGMRDPGTRIEEIKRLIVYVELDRCTADAVAHVTGVRLGRRSLKFQDYGIMAATFLDLASGLAYRIVSTETARSLTELYAPEVSGKSRQQLEAYQRMPDSVLFRVQRVEVPLEECDLPGPTRRKVVCVSCGQVIRDRREVVSAGRVLCRPCAQGAYYRNAREITWEYMNWTPVKAGGAEAPLDPRNGKAY